MIEVGAPRGAIRAEPGRPARGPGQRRGRRDAGAGDAARPGRRSDRRGRSGGSTARATAPSTASPTRSTTCSPGSRRPPGRLLQRPGPATSRASTSTSRGRLTGPVLDDARRPDRRRLLPLRPGAVHARHRRRAWPLGASRPTGSARRSSGRPTRSRPGSSTRPTATAPAGGPPGTGPDDLVQPQQPHRRLGPRVPEPARAGRGLRRAGEVVVPHRRVPHLRDRTGERRVGYRPDPLEPPGAGQRADLLLPARRRRRPRPLTPRPSPGRMNRSPMLVSEQPAQAVVILGARGATLEVCAHARGPRHRRRRRRRPSSSST